LVRNNGDLMRSRKRKKKKLVGITPSVDKVIMDTKAFEKAIRVGYETDTEVGFYMIGLIRNKEAIVYDLIEFPYSEKTPVSIASDPYKVARIFSIVPLGLSIIGIMHKHPDTIGSSYSSVDAETFLRWAGDGVHAHVIFAKGGKDVSAYTVANNEIVKIDFQVADSLADKLRFSYVEITTRIPFFYHVEDTVASLLSRLEGGLPYAIMKEVTPVRVKNAKIFHKLADISRLEFERRARFLVLIDEKGVGYEFIFPTDKRFGDVKKEIMEVLRLPGNVIFLCNNEVINDEISLEQINGKVIHTRKPLEEFIRELILEEVKKLKEELLGEIHNYSLKELEARLNKIEKKLLRELKKFLEKEMRG